MEFIKELLLESEVNVGIIAETEVILGIADELMDDGVIIYHNGEKEQEDIVEENSILQLTKMICDDCEKVTYFIEEVFDEEGYTIPDDELAITYVDSDLLDCIEYTALDTEIVPVEIEYVDDEDECDGDCENCTLHKDEDLEDYDEETMGVLLAHEFLDSLEEINEDDGEEVYNLIVEFMQMAYNAGRDDSLAELTDAFESIKSLR